MAEKITIHVHLQGDTAYADEPMRLGCSGSYGLYQLAVTADDKWNGLEIRSVWPCGMDTITMPVVNGFVDVPAEATSASTVCTPRWITFVGVAEGQRKISCNLGYKVESGGPAKGNESRGPQITLLDQLIQRTKAAEEQAHQAPVYADAAKHSAQTAADIASDLAQTAASTKQAIRNLGQTEQQTLTALASQQTSAFVQKAQQAMNDISTARDDAYRASHQAENAHMSADAARLGAERAQAAANHAWAKAEQEAERAKSILDDSTVNIEKGWSSSKINDFIIENLCFPFESSGSVLSSDHFQANSTMELSLALSPIQEGSGVPSPKNIRPVRSRSTILGTHCGLNLLNPEPLNTHPAISVSDDGTITFDSRRYPYVTWYEDLVLKKGTYVARTVTESKNIEVWINAPEIGNYIWNANMSNVGYSSKTLTYDQKCKIILVNATAEVVSFKTQLELNSVPAPYQKYHSESFVVNLGQEIFDGTVNLHSGKGLITGISKPLTGTEPIQQKKGLAEISFVDGQSSEACSQISTPAVCSHASGAVTTAKTFVHIPTALSADEYRTFLIQQNDLGTPVTVAYKLFRPVSFTLSPEQLLQLRAYGYGDTIYTTDSFCNLDVKGYMNPKAAMRIMSSRIEDLENAAVNNGGM